MSKQIFCTALAVLFVTCIKAQSFGEIRGKVRDDRKDLAIGAIVVADNGVEQLGVQTGSDGVYRIKPLKPGKYNVRITFFGMDTILVGGVVVNADKITMMKDYNLSPMAIEGPEIDFVEYVIPLIYKDGDHIQTMTAEELKNMSSANGGSIASIIKSMSSDIKPVGNGGMSVRGSREGGVLFFVDGVKIRNSDVVVPSSGIGSVSMYTGGIPAKYGDTTGGVVIVETKSYLEEYYKKLNQ